MSEAQERAAPVGSARRLPRWRRVLGDTLVGGPVALAIPILCAVLLLLFPLFADSPYWTRQLSLMAVLALALSGINLSFGYAGEIQFGQVFMYALGAYVAMILGSRVTAEIIPLVIIGGIAAAVVGAVIAGPALRIGGWSLALTSFFLVITIPNLVSIFSKYTGGLNGFTDVATPTIAGQPLDADGLYLVTIAFTIIWFTIYRNLVTSRYGVVFRILRESPVLANSLGFSTARLKFMAYTTGAFPAGMAGALYGFISLILTPSVFGLSLAIGMIAGSLLGGVESVYGAFLAAAVLHYLPEQSLDFAQYAPVAYGAFLVVAAIVFRDGLGGVSKRLAMRLSERVVEPDAAAHTTVPGSLSAHIGHTAELGRAGEAVPRELPALDGSRLEISSVSKHFGGLRALDDVSLTAEPGSVTALIGANGSGKTTMLNLISGYSKPTHGTVAFGDRELTGLPAHNIARKGVGRTFQTPLVPRGVSTLDVVASGRFNVDHCGPLASVLRLPAYWRSRRRDRDQALVMLEFVGLGHLADEEAGSLSLGTRRLVEVARSLCAGPRLLLLDEPASGLSESEVDRLGEVITAAARAGATVVLIEHNFRFVTAVSDVAHVLDFGTVIASGEAETIAKDPRVVASFLGEEPAATVDAPSRVDGERNGSDAALNPRIVSAAATVASRARQGGGPAGPVLEVANAVSGYADLPVLRGVSLTLQEGRIEVLLGRNGVGKTTLLGTITGQNRLWSGSVKLDGRDLGGKAAYRRAAAGVALVQEGKRIFRDRSIFENVALGTFRQSVSRAERRRLCTDVLAGFPVLEARAQEPAGGLSGGQQQMLAIAQALASKPRVLLLDEPSAGLAPSIVSELFARLKEFSDSGMTILLVEQLAEQALVIGDHVTVMDNGAIVASGPPEDFKDQRRLHEAYFGRAPG